MSHPQTPPAGVDPVEYAAWLVAQDQRNDARSADHEGVEWSEVMAQLSTLPPETEAEKADREKRLAELAVRERVAAFRKVCPTEFMEKIDRQKLVDPAAFDRVAGWDGHTPGILAWGPTDCAKTRAVWSALGRLNVHEGKSFAWFPAKRLITEFLRFENKDLADEFWRYYRKFDLLFVDDIDKINWSFDSETSALFSFYDWVYRECRPCITTTNKNREWWSEKMGDAFTRRLFNDVHFAVQFK